jgi:glycine/D-amino acid oxidase-like deaminating enzyme
LNKFKRSDETTEPLAEKILAVRVSAEVDEVVRSLPQKAAWLRRVINEAAQRELMKDGEGMTAAQLDRLDRIEALLDRMASDSARSKEESDRRMGRLEESHAALSRDLAQLVSTQQAGEVQRQELREAVIRLADTTNWFECTTACLGSFEAKSFEYEVNVLTLLKFSGSCC